MKQFQKIFLVLAFMVTLFPLSPRAATATGGTSAAVAKAVEEAAAPLVTGYAPTLFYLFGNKSIPITNSMVYAWVVAAVIIVFVRVGTRRLSAENVPTGAGNLIEALIEGWESLINMILEPKVTRWVFPFAVTYFIFALTSNLLGLLPGVGSIGYGPKAPADQNFSGLPFSIEHAVTPLVRPPTADANMTVVMALIFLVMSLYWGFRYNGPLGLVKHIFGVKVESNKLFYVPLLLMFVFVGLMETLSIVFVRPLALAIRLYGNIFAGESLLAMTMTMKNFFLSLLVSLPFTFFELFVAVVQAFVFAMLTIVFAGTLCSHSEEEHGH